VATPSTCSSTLTRGVDLPRPRCLPDSRDGTVVAFSMPLGGLISGRPFRPLSRAISPRCGAAAEEAPPDLCRCRRMGPGEWGSNFDRMEGVQEPASRHSARPRSCLSRGLVWVGRLPWDGPDRQYRKDIPTIRAGTGLGLFPWYPELNRVVCARSREDPSRHSYVPCSQLSCSMEGLGCVSRDWEDHQSEPLLRFIPGSPGLGPTGRHRNHGDVARAHAAPAPRRYSSISVSLL
jgi:hypothetical protein